MLRRKTSRPLLIYWIRFEAMENLAEHPQLGHWREDLTHHEVRFWPFKWHYLIVYKESNPIEIVRVLGGYRDLSVILG